MAKIDFSARGNAVGFTAAGDVITGRKAKGRSGDWTVEVGDAALALTNGTRRQFADKAAAVAYAAGLIDAAKTKELAWWSV